MIRKPLLAFITFILLGITVHFSSCKSCNNAGKTPVTADTTSTSQAPATNPYAVTAPHADTSLIPELAKVLEDVLDASAKKDYKRMAPYIVYRGQNENRYLHDTYDVKNVHERNMVKITADVFNKWNRGVEMIEYPRVFEVDQPGAGKILVLEVLFLTPKTVDRKFFAFLKIYDGYKIVDVSSYL